LDNLIEKSTWKKVWIPIPNKSNENKITP
jgi:hypothetical protein